MLFFTPRIRCTFEPVCVSFFDDLPARYEAAADNEPLEGEGEGQRGEGGAATRPTSPSPTRKARTGERGHGGATRQGEGRLHCGGEEGGFFREAPGEARFFGQSRESDEGTSLCKDGAQQQQQQQCQEFDILGREARQGRAETDG